jgi:alpha-beta hydrolase superfamily lysophospholipase
MIIRASYKASGNQMALAKALFFVLVAYLCVAALVCVFLRDFIYFPDHTYVSPSQAHAHKDFGELAVTTEDGLHLKGWYAPAKAKRLTLVFFHGNSDNLGTAAKIADPYLHAGYGFLLAEYRGYSGLPGRPTENGLYADARAFLKALIASGVHETDLVLFGHSLGTGVATQIATEFHVAGIILLAPFLSVDKIAQAWLPIFPAKLLVLDRFENFRKIPTANVPLLVAQGAKDMMVPAADAQRLYDLANEPKEFHLFAEGQHDIFDEGQHDNLLNLGFVPISLSWLERLGAAHQAMNSPNDTKLCETPTPFGIDNQGA